MFASFLSFVCLLLCFCWFFFFKQKTAYEMRISDWSSDVCSSDLVVVAGEGEGDAGIALGRRGRVVGRGSAREAQQGLAGHTVVAEEGSGVALVGHQQVVAGHRKAEALLPGGSRRAAVRRCLAASEREGLAGDAVVPGARPGFYRK